jgi:uncharacterized protein (TIGR03437 family)
MIGALSAPVWYASRLRSAATLLCHPFLQSVGEDRATIVWATAEEFAGCEVRFSGNGQPVRSASSSVREFFPSDTELSSPFYLHKSVLTGLEPNTDYAYEVLGDAQYLAGGSGFRFRTAGSGAFSFLAFGDSGSGTAEQLALARLMEQERPSFVLPLGDLAYMTGTFEQFQSRYFGIYRELMKRVAFFPCLGNHDYMTRSGFPYLTLHDVPSPQSVPPGDRGRYYSFDWGNAHFIALDSNDPLVYAAQGTGPMLEWLENDLRNTRKFWKIAYVHHAPYAAGVNENDPLSDLVRRHVVPILERYGVALVLSGHEHSYQRSYPMRGGEAVNDGEGTVYLTSGGGGMTLYPVPVRSSVRIGRSEPHYLRVEMQGTRLTVRAVGLSGNELDVLVLSPPPSISQGGVVNAASWGQELAPGTLISIFGSHLAPNPSQASGLPLPRELAGVSATANGEPVPLLYASPTQINAQLPFRMQGWVALRVRTPNGVFDTSVFLSEAAPGIFAVVHQNGVRVSSDFPTQPGEILSIYATGLGEVSGPIAAGEPAPYAPLLTARLPVEVEFDNALLRPLFAGLTPGAVGLYQVNFQVPGTLGSGHRSLRLRTGGSASQTTAVPVATGLVV